MEDKYRGKTIQDIVRSELPARQPRDGPKPFITTLEDLALHLQSMQSLAKVFGDTAEYKPGSVLGDDLQKALEAVQVLGIPDCPLANVELNTKADVNSAIVESLKWLHIELIKHDAIDGSHAVREAWGTDERPPWNVKLDPPQVIIEKRDAISLTPDGALLLDALLDAYPGFVTASQIVGRRPDRVAKTLPAPVKAWLETSTKGYRLRRPS